MPRHGKEYNGNLTKLQKKGFHSLLPNEGTVSIVTGGGGGITSDNPGALSAEGNDDAYGFMEFHATLEELKPT